MSLELAGLSWLWEQYGKSLSDKLIGELHEQFSKFRWKEAEAKYRTRVSELYNTTRLLGHPKPIKIDEIYTDAYVLSKLTAFQRFDLSALQARQFQRQSDYDSKETKTKALDIALNNDRLFILGKPGAGKTTFMKYLALQASKGNISSTPIFISMKEWSDSGIDLIDFISLQFDICHFPEAKLFIEHLLTHGNALVLFDGLDEVNQENNLRMQAIKSLINFSRKYSKSRICLTCRVAASHYTFDQFTYIEIADFSNEQIEIFAGKWYQEDINTLRRFTTEFRKPENSCLRELAQTPLLLTLLCLAFDETLSFPSRRVDLYKEALDALLKKWDASRGIKRDEVYKKLSPTRKEQLLARIAAQNFEDGIYFVRQEKIITHINNYLRQLPSESSEEHLDGEVVLKSIEAQHGLLVERAQGIYSFSHLTFQEYLTARYIVENSASGTLDRLMVNHIADDQWREVILLTTSLLDNADSLFDAFSKTINKISSANKVQTLLQWANSRAGTEKEIRANARITYFLTALTISLAYNLKNVLDYSQSRINNQAQKLSKHFDQDVDLDRELRKTIDKIQSKAFFNALDRSIFRIYQAAIDQTFSLASEYDLDKDLLRQIQRSKDFFSAIAKATIQGNINNMERILRPWLNFANVSNLENEWNLSNKDLRQVLELLRICRLYIECFNLATLTNRTKTKERLLELSVSE